MMALATVITASEHLSLKQWLIPTEMDLIGKFVKGAPMPRVTCDICGHLVKEKFVVVIEYPDGSKKVTCKTCMVK